MGTTEKEALKDQVNEFEHDLLRVMVNEGVEFKALEQQIADPTPHLDVQIQLLSAETGIPKRILVGSERGELSSAQDKQEWISYVTSRREEQNEPMILRPFIDKCIALNVLPIPEAEEYIIIWDKLFSLSDKEKADVGKVRAESLKEYSTNPVAMEFIPVETFLEYNWGLDKTQIDKVLETIGNVDLKELALTAKEQELANKKTQAGGADVINPKPTNKTSKSK
jgi:hypothetical protein